MAPNASRMFNLVLEIERYAYFHTCFCFYLSSHNLMIQLREDVMKVLQFANPNYDLTRELIGQYLHILQMFYSNTNWVEIKGATPYFSLGEKTV